MGFADAIRTCFRKYATFSGRAPRSEYWWFALFCFLGSLGAGILDNALFGTGTFETSMGSGRAGFHAQSNGPLGAIFGLAAFLPAVAAGWRRMHDSGRSGLYLLYPLIVIVGIATFTGFVGGLSHMWGVAGDPMAGAPGLVVGLAVLVFILSPLLVVWWLTRPTQPGSNQYGPNPFEVTP